MTAIRPGRHERKVQRSMGKMTEAQARGRIDANRFADMQLDDAARAIWKEQFDRDQETIIRIVERMTGRTAEAADIDEGSATCSVDGLEFVRVREGIALLHSCTLCGKTNRMQAQDLRVLGSTLAYLDAHDGRCEECRDAVVIAHRQKLAAKEAK